MAAPKLTYCHISYLIITVILFFIFNLKFNFNFRLFFSKTFKLKTHNKSKVILSKIILGFNFMPNEYRDINSNIFFEVYR
jgi:hypothetical protein